MEEHRTEAIRESRVALIEGKRDRSSPPHPGSRHMIISISAEGRGFARSLRKVFFGPNLDLAISSGRNHNQIVFRVGQKKMRRRFGRRLVRVPKS
jgi:hypothetical protein